MLFQHFNSNLTLQSSQISWHLSLYINKIIAQMSENANFGFATEPPAASTQPQSKAHMRRSQGGSPYEKLRAVKEKVREAEQSFLQQVATHHKARRSLEEVTRKSLIKRIEFLKVYGNKRSKYQHREMLEAMRKDSEQAERKSVDLVRRRKLQNQLHHILIQNEEEEHVYRLQSRNRENKQMLRRQLQLTSQREQNMLKHDLVRKANTDFLIRKKNIQTSVSMRSKHNYFTKISHELSMIKQYEDIMTEIQNFATLQPGKFDQQSTMFRTLQHTPHAFVTTDFQTLS